MSPPVPNCSLGGTHYLGKTSQGQKLCLTISGKISTGNAVFREFVFGARFTCADGTRKPGAMHRTPKVYDTFAGVEGITLRLSGPSYSNHVTGINGIAEDGRISDTDTRPALEVAMIFSGRITGDAAKGTLFENLIPGRNYKGPLCRTGAVRWTARLAGAK